MHQTNRLCIAFEMTEILSHLTPQCIMRIAFQPQCFNLTSIITRQCIILNISGIQPFSKPVVDSRLTKMAKGRVADVMHQAGHSYHAFKGRLPQGQAKGVQSIFAFYSHQNIFGDVATDLLHFHRVRQPRTHSGVTLQRKYLRLLL